MDNLPAAITYPAILEDAREIGPKLRRADLDELTAVHGPVVPHEVLRESLRASEKRYLVRVHGSPAFLFGVVDTPEMGRIWAMGSDELFAPEHRRVFMQQTRMWIDRLHEKWPVLGNRVDARNTVHIRFLKWAGFEFLETGTMVNGLPFLEFRKHV